MNALKIICLLIAKDLRIEARTRQTMGLVVLLGILIIVVLGLGLSPGGRSNGIAATAILWVAYLFSGVLCFEKTMAVECNDGAMAALLDAPIDRGIIFAAKLLTNLILVISLGLIITPVAILLFDFNLAYAPLEFLIVTLLSMTGFTAVGTLFAAITSSSRLQGGLLAIMVFPICMPVVIISTQLLMSIFRDHMPMEWSTVGLLVTFDVVFLIVSWLAFERVLEP